MGLEPFFHDNVFWNITLESCSDLVYWVKWIGKGRWMKGLGVKWIRPVNKFVIASAFGPEVGI